MNRRQFLSRAISALLANLAASTTLPAASGAKGQPAARRRPAEIAIIIDDIGFSRSRAHRFLPLKLPLTFSVLPRITYTAELSHTLHAEGCVGSGNGAAGVAGGRL